MAEKQDEAWRKENVDAEKNHPGSRYGTAPEERPDLSPEVPPAVVPDVQPDAVPDVVPGSRPENAGQDLGDIHRDEGEEGRPRSAKRKE